MTQIKMSNIVTPAFRRFWRECNKTKDRKLYKVLKGGRNSAKSSHVSVRIIYDLMRMPANALVVRKVAKTLAESVFEQLVWAIDLLGVTHLWKINKSPLRLTYKPRGNMVIFRGADDPSKIKSLKTSKFPIAIFWAEEIAEWKTEDEMTTIVNSVLRSELPDGLHYDIYYSYNPPKRKQSWLNKKFESITLPDNVYMHKSTYMDNPYTSKEFIVEAEETKKKNENKYKWIYLGEPIGSGIVPFENLIFRKITDAEIASFDNIKQGIDWGYANDPAAFGRGHYDKTRKKLYVFGEIYGVKLSNRKLAEKIKEKGWQNELIIADSAEPKSINDMNEFGLWCIAAKKGPGSIEYGEKWLDDELDEIIIDPYRCPNHAREFENIDYQVDKNGDPINKLSEEDNHTIDLWRYALERDMSNRIRNAGTGQSKY